MSAMRISLRRWMSLIVGLICTTAPGIAFGQRSSYDFDKFTEGRAAADRFGAHARESFSQLGDRFGGLSGSGSSAGALGGGTAWGPAPAMGSLSFNPYEDAAREASSDRSSPSRVALCAKRAVRENAVLIGVTTLNCIGAVKSPKKAEKCIEGLKTTGVSLGASFASCIADGGSDD